MQIKRILVTKIDKYEKNKDGEYYTYTSNRDGKKHRFVRVVVSYDGSKEQISHTAFNPSDPVLEWKPGEEHDVVMRQNGNYVNFDDPNRIDMLEYRLEYAELAIKALQKKSGIDTEIEDIEPPIAEEKEEEVEW